MRAILASAGALDLTSLLSLSMQFDVRVHARMPSGSPITVIASSNPASSRSAALGASPA